MNVRALRSWLWPLAVFAVAFVVLVIVSRLTAPAFDEMGLIAGIDQKAELVKRIAARGFGELVQPETRAALEPQPALLGLFGAWTRLSLGRAVDPLTAERLPWLLLGAGGVVSVYSMLRPSRGRWVAVGAAFLLLFTPRFAHAIVVRREAALVACLWLVVLACYARTLARGKTLCWSVVGGVVFGIGVALSFGTAWLILLVIVHYAWVRARSTRRLLRHGRLPIPSFALFSVALAPAALFLTSPALWKQNGAGIARYLLSGLAPNISKSEYAGKIVSGMPLPGGFAIASIVQTLPWLILSAALAGVGVLAHEALARRFATGRFRPPFDRVRIPLLALLGVLAVLIGPAVTPEVLSVFPPRIELALPFLAILAALGIERLSSLIRAPRLRLVAVGAIALALVVTTLSAPSTLSAATSPFVGGAGRIASSHALALGDGSELGGVASALDRLGSDAVGVRAPPEVLPEYWETLRKSRRMKTSVVRAAPTTVSLVRGKAPGSERIAEIKRDGAVLWTLLRH